jgi:hypothetical protein
MAKKAVKAKATKKKPKNAVKAPVPIDAAPVAPVEDVVIDPNEPVYCSCKRISFGEMIACENPNCPTEWYHFECAGLTEAPNVDWYCPTCIHLQVPAPAGQVEVLIVESPEKSNVETTEVMIVESTEVMIVESPEKSIVVKKNPRPSSEELYDLLEELVEIDEEFKRPIEKSEKKRPPPESFDLSNLNDDDDGDDDEDVESEHENDAIQLFRLNATIGTIIFIIIIIFIVITTITTITTIITIITITSG